MDIEEFFAQLIRRRGPENFTKEVQLKEILTNLAPGVSERAKEFANKLFQYENIRGVELIGWSYEIKNSSQSPVCSKIMSEGLNSISFRCFDCMESSSSCICGDCFIEGDHKGHNYLQYGSVNGCCDCGNSQAWNQKGFCKTHASITHASHEIDQQIRKIYLRQVQFLLYIYFYLLKKESKKSLLEEYGNQLFTYLTKISHQNYEMKLLACQLMLSKFSEEYTEVPLREFNILEIFFRLPAQEVKAYSELIHWLFEVFPVEEIKKKIIKEYFAKMRRIEDRMVADHPISGLNFQYLSCVKMITQMIKNKELQPLQLPTANCSLLEAAEIHQFPNLFKKYYQDLDYINNMKSAKDYHKIHLQLTNITQMAGYRQLSKVDSKIVSTINPFAISQFNVDEMFLKTLSKFIVNVKEDKELLAKGITELFHFIFNAGQNLASLAQERAFAMLVLVYFEGDLNRLFSENVRSDFMKTLIVNSGQYKMMLQTIIRTTLKTSFNIVRLKPSEKSSYQQYFMRINAEKNVPEYLDVIFQKILMFLSQGICEYDEIVLGLFKQKLSKLQKEEVESQQARKEQLNNFIADMLVVLNKINSIIRLELDETVINNILQIDCKEKVFDIFGRILVTYKQLNVKEFKHLCLEVVNKEELFEEFVTTQTTPEKGKLKLKNNLKPLEYIIFSNVFKRCSIPLPQTDICHLTGEELYPRFRDIKIYNKELISIAIQKSMQLIYQMDEPNNSITSALLEAIAKEIFKIYLWDRENEEPKYFFCTLLNPSIRSLFPKSLIEQITLIEKKEEELAHDLIKIKLEEAEKFRLKREKIMNKRKITEEMMKKNQESMLSKFTKEVEEIKNQDEPKQICIYCKEITNEPLSLISYVGLTNLVERALLKQNRFHYFFSSCKHRIHASCYMQVNQQQVRKYCFLCKQEANILIPELTHCEQKNEAVRQLAANFIANIISSLLDENQMQDGKIGAFQNKIFQENLQLFIVSLSKEVVYNALHNLAYFKKNLFPIFVQFFQVFALLNKEFLTETFDQLRIHFTSKENKHKLELFERGFTLRLEEHFLERKIDEEIQGLSLSLEEMNQIDAIFTCLNTKNAEIEVKELKQINLDTLFIKIPDSLTELHHYMGQCKICPNITNNIFLCLVCGWSGCIKCVKKIIEHVSEQHIDGAIIVGCSTGTVKYFKGSRIFEDNSIYENYLGLSFSDAETYAQFGKADKYLVNRQKEVDLHKLMMHYEVHQKIQLNAGMS